MLCGVADIYDAMRSQRHYQEAFPTDRILAVLQRNDGTQFDQNLVRRFAHSWHLPGGEPRPPEHGRDRRRAEDVGPDPYRPRVRVLRGADGTDLARPSRSTSGKRRKDGRCRSGPTGPAAPRNRSAVTSLTHRMNGPLPAR